MDTNKNIEKLFIIEYTLKDGEKAFFAWQGEPGIWKEWQSYPELEKAKEELKKLKQAKSNWERYNFRLKQEKE